MGSDLQAAHKREIGQLGEGIATDFLKRKGFTIIERNYRKPWGEIDIIAEKRNEVRFVEVKSVARENSDMLSRENVDYRPEELVHPFKLKKIMRTAEMYMNAKRDMRDFQIDVVGVILDLKTRRARCRLFEQVL